MLDVADRRCVEAIRGAREIRIIINNGEESFFFSETRGAFPVFKSELRYAVQNYMNKSQRR